ncbi:MAG: tetratricopeptide repeat protein [Deltaproteobacteria bacterium]
MISYRAIRLYCYLLLWFAILMVFMPCVGNQFVDWDDLAFVTRNHHISTISPASIRWMLTTFYQGAWHPLTWFSHALDRSLWGASSTYHHLVNVLIHSLNVLLFCSLVVRLLQAKVLSQRLQYITAFTAALFFGIHPLRVESVAWVAQRKDVLCAFFFLASLIVYLSYARSESSGSRGRYYLISLALCFAALLSKPMAMTLPFVLLLIDWYPLERLTASTFWSRVREKIPFFVLAGLTAFLNMLAAGEGAVPFSYVPAHMRIMNAFCALVFYVRQTIAPSNLMPLYQLDRSLDYFGPRFIFCAVLVSLVTIVCVWRAWKRDRLWAAVWFYYLITIGPALGLFMSYRHAMADRYTYLPTLGFWLLFGLGVSRLWEVSGRLSAPRAAKGGLIACLVLLAFAYGHQTQRQISVWRNSETLWGHVIQHGKYVPALAYFSLGKIMENKGEYDKAMAYYQTALSLNPKNNRYRAGIANIISKKGNRKEALRIYEQILQEEPDNSGAYVNVGRILALMGRLDQAVKAFDRALQLQPDNGQALLLIAIAYLEKGDKATALDYYDKYLSKGFPAKPEVDRELGKTTSNPLHIR